MYHRNSNLRKNIMRTAVIKAIGMGCSLLIVPVTLHYLDNEEYGVWMTMSSILMWFSFFDIGLGNGLRNYLTGAVSKNNMALGRTYIATAFTLLSVMALLFLVIMMVPIRLLDMAWVFNTHHVDSLMLRDITLIAVVFTLANFVVKNIGYVFVALQQYAVNEGLYVLSNLLSLIIIFVLTRVTAHGHLPYVVMVFTATPVIVFSAAAIPLFLRHPELYPSFRDIDITYSRQLVGKGLGFFLIQISSALVIYGSSNLFIAQYGTPSDVTVYNIAYKFFNLLSVAYTIVISPMWSAYTDAYVRGDMLWIRRTFRKAQLFWILSLGGGILMLMLSALVYRIWVGTGIVIPMTVSASVLCYILLFNFNNCVTYLLNGLNKIKIQIITSAIATLLYLALVFTVGKRWGIVGVSLSMSASYLLLSLVHLYQCRLIISGRARGIWNE